jgi:hypothetical protein
MLNWFDIIRRAQDGAGLDNMAGHFGLTAEQTRSAVAALMPAYLMGLRYLAANPTAMAQLFRMTTTGPYPNFWESAAQAFTPDARQEGDRLLDQLFGSDEVTRRVAHQAAAVSGIGVDVMQQMLPLLAGIVAGGIAKVARGQGAMLNPFANPPAEAEKSPAPSDPITAWVDLWRRFMGLPPEARTQESVKESVEEPTKKSVKPRTTGPTFRYEDMMAGFLNPPPQPERRAKSAPAAKPRPEPPEPPANPLEAWEKMMDAGREMQRQHLASLQSIFESAWGRSPQER